jgi:MFS family permease
VTGLRTTWRITEFRALLLSYVINRAGDVLGALALAVVVLGTTGSALATAALFLATQFLPGLLGPFFVARVGMLPAGRLLPVIYALEACLFGLLALIAPGAGLVAVVALAFVDASLAFCARSVTRATTASTLIPHDLVPEGKAAFNLALAAATVAGPLAAGAVLATLGPRAALLVDGLSFLLAAGLVARAAALRKHTAPAPSRSPRAGRLRASISYIARQPTLRALIFGEGIAFVFFYLVVPVTVVYATRSLHAGAAGYAAILASWGAGIAIGSGMHVGLARRAAHGTILISTAAVAVGYLGTALAPTLPVACAVSVLGGMGNGTQWASVETAVHRVVEEAFRVRVAAVLEALAAIAPGIGIVLGGTLTALFSPRAAYLLAGLGLIVLSAAGALSRVLVVRVGAELPKAPRAPAHPVQPPDRAQPAPVGLA